MSEKWFLTENRITNFEFRNLKSFNMLITDQMYIKLKAISNKLGVKGILSKIISYGIGGLKNVTSDITEWKIFHHLISDRSTDGNYKNNSKYENKSKIDKENSEKREKKRKHLHHFVEIIISREEYREIRDLHYRINTFSMALIIRMIAEIFLDLYAKYNDVDTALNKLVQTIEKMNSQAVNCKAEFVLFREVSASQSKKWRAWAYFQVTYLDEFGNTVYFIRLRL